MSDPGHLLTNKLTEPLEDARLEVDGDMSSLFRTKRLSTLNAVTRVLQHTPFLIVRGPPMSGKSGLCTLLANHLLSVHPQMLVARVCANQKPISIPFHDWFKSIYNISLEDFLTLANPRALLIDEGQITHDDRELWLNNLEAVMEGQYLNLKVVIFSSFGTIRQFKRRKTPIHISSATALGLKSSVGKPGLQLSRDEFDEMIQGTIGEFAPNLVWDMCSGP